MSAAPKMSKAERLAVGGVVAPIVRTARARTITRVDRNGKPVGTTTSVEVARSLLARSEIEFSMQEGKRPEYLNCRISLGVPRATFARQLAALGIRARSRPTRGRSEHQ